MNYLSEIKIFNDFFFINNTNISFTRYYFQRNNLANNQITLYYTKKFFGIARCNITHLVIIARQYQRQFFCDTCYICRLVSLSSVRNWCKIWRICF